MNLRKYREQKISEIGSPHSRCAASAYAGTRGAGSMKETKNHSEDQRHRYAPETQLNRL